MPSSRTNLSISPLPSDWFFPTTRYRGSKRKILPWIWENLKDLSFKSTLDLFGGTSVVSQLFKRMGKQVTYNDYSYFNYLGGSTFIANSNTKLTQTDLNFILQKSKSFETKFISNNYNSYYFLDDENEWLDNILTRINDLKETYQDIELFQKKALAIWAVGQSCLIKRPFNLFHRKNLNLRTSDVERKFGNKTTWETPFPVAFQRFVGEANRVIFSNDKENFAVYSDGLEYQNNNYDLVYLDPPYFFEKQSDEDYLKLYHFLDGIGQYDVWADLIDRNSSILSIKREKRWPAKSISQLTDIYKSLIDRFDKSIIVISHKSGSLVPISILSKLLEEKGKSVLIKEKSYSYALNKQNGKSHENTECLIIGK
jgi:adenine-specific DNA-methyltransferase